MSDADETPARGFRPSRRDLLIGGTCLITAGATYARMPRHKIASIPAGKLEKLIPQTIGNWEYQTASGVVLPPPDELARLLYDQQISRVYSNDHDAPVMLVMAYGSSQGGMLQVHRPEICYPASGFRLTETATERLNIGTGHSIPIRTFDATSDTRSEHVVYWTRIGEALPTSWTGQRMAIMESNLRGMIPDGLLVRVSTTEAGDRAARRTLESFIAAMLAAIGPTGRRQLIGSAAA